MATLPGIYMSFKTAAAAAIEGASRGRIGLIRQNASGTEDKIKVYDISNKSTAKTDFPEDYGKIEMAFKGMAKEVVVFEIGAMATTPSTYTDAVNELVARRCNAMCIIDDADDLVLQTFIDDVKSHNQTGHFRFFGVVANKTADDVNIVNFATQSAVSGETTYTVQDLLPFVTARVGSVPFNKSLTYETVSWLDDTEHLTKAEMETAIDNGELRLIFDGEKVKFLTGINSLSTIGEGMDETWKKLRVISTMQQIQNDIHKTAENAYIGKVHNNADGQAQLIGAVKNYMSRLVQLNGIQDDFDVYLDPEMPSTGDTLCLAGYYKALDSVEKLNINWTLKGE